MSEKLTDGWYWVKFAYRPEDPPEICLKQGNEWWQIGNEFPYPAEGFDERNKVLGGPLEVIK